MTTCRTHHRLKPEPHVPGGVAGVWLGTLRPPTATRHAEVGDHPAALTSRRIGANPPGLWSASGARHDKRSALKTGVGLESIARRETNRRRPMLENTGLRWPSAEKSFGLRSAKHEPVFRIGFHYQAVNRNP